MFHLYNAFIGTQSTLHMKRGNLLNHHQCAASTWMMLWQSCWTRTHTSLTYTSSSSNL